MSIKNINSCGLSKKSSSSTVDILTNPWVRNPSWLTLPDVSLAEQKFVGLFAVYPNTNFVALQVSGNYQVNWGDGTVETFNSATIAYHEYSFSNSNLDNTNAPVTFTDATNLVSRNNHGYYNGMKVSFSSITTSTGINTDVLYYVINATTNTFQVSETIGGSEVNIVSDGNGYILPYKQAIVTVIPQSGANITSFNTNVRHTSMTQVHAVNWLDLNMSFPQATTLTLGASAVNVKHAFVERVKIRTSNLTSASNLLNSFYSLELADLDFSDKITNTTYMFYSCQNLKTSPMFDTSKVTTMSNMFQNCTVLEYVPAYNTNSCTSFSSMFNTCFMLKKIPTLNSANVTNMLNMFYNCHSLEKAPELNTIKVTNMSNMFYECRSLKTVPLYNTVACTNMGSMFQNCFSLVKVPLFNTTVCTNMANMFQNCNALVYVPKFNTPNLNSSSYMFYSCQNLKNVPLFDTSKCTSTSYMFYGCFSLTKVPNFDMTLNTNMTNMFQNCYSLATIPTISVSVVTNFSNMFLNCYSLSKIDMTGYRYSFSVANCKLSSTELDNIYNNLATTTGQTITVSGNYGISGDTPSIATGKGWTVSGS